MAGLRASGAAVASRPHAWKWINGGVFDGAAPMVGSKVWISQRGSIACRCASNVKSLREPME